MQFMIPLSERKGITISIHHNIQSFHGFSQMEMEMTAETFPMLHLIFSL